MPSISHATPLTPETGSAPGRRIMPEIRQQRIWRTSRVLLPARLQHMWSSSCPLTPHLAAIPASYSSATIGSRCSAQSAWPTVAWEASNSNTMPLVLTLTARVYSLRVVLVPRAGCRPTADLSISRWYHRITSASCLDPHIRYMVDSSSQAAKLAVHGEQQHQLFTISRRGGRPARCASSHSVIPTPESPGQG
jgi:hypothetical protein